MLMDEVFVINVKANKTKNNKAFEVASKSVEKSGLKR